MAARLREAIESERYEDALPLLEEYSASVVAMCDAAMCEAAMCETADAPPQEQVRELMEWALRAVTAARAHASDQFQLLSDSRVYAASNPNRKTWQVMA